MPDVLLAYAVAALLVAVVLVIAFGVSLGFRGATPRSRNFLNLFGLIIIAIALLEKGGWSARHWTAGSPAAGFDDLLFRLLLLVGFGLVFVARMSEPR
jgi:hypothetical protein